MIKYISLILFIGLSWGQKEYNIDHIEKQGVVYKQKVSDEIVNGNIFQISGEMKLPLGMMKDGKKTGKWMVWYNDGTKKQEGTFNDDGRRDGLWTYWDKSNGKEYKGKVEVSFEDGGVIGAMIYDGGGFEWYPNNEIKSYNSYKNGTLDGLITRWYDNGQKETEYTLKNRNYDGLFTRWRVNGGKEREGTFKDGKKDGKWTEWYDNGQKMYEGTYKGLDKWGDPQLDGVYTGWYDNGQKRSYGTYKVGNKDSKWTYWYKNGQKMDEETFKDGHLISEKKWNKDGSLIE